MACRKNKTLTKCDDSSKDKRPQRNLSMHDFQKRNKEGIEPSEMKLLHDKTKAKRTDLSDTFLLERKCRHIPNKRG